MSCVADTIYSCLVQRDSDDSRPKLETMSSSSTNQSTSDGLEMSTFATLRASTSDAGKALKDYGSMIF